MKKSEFNKAEIEEMAKEGTTRELLRALFASMDEQEVAFLEDMLRHSFDKDTAENILEGNSIDTPFIKELTPALANWVVMDSYTGEDEQEAILACALENPVILEAFQKAHPGKAPDGNQELLWEFLTYA